MVISILHWIACWLYYLAGLPVSREVKPMSAARVSFSVACITGQTLWSLFQLYRLMTTIENTSGYELFSKLYWGLYPLMCTLTSIKMALRNEYFSITSVRVEFVQELMREKGIENGPPRVWTCMAVCWAVNVLLSVITSSIGTFQIFKNVQDYMANKGALIVAIVQFILTFPSQAIFFAVLYQSCLNYLIEFWIIGEIHREMTKGGRMTESRQVRDAGVEPEVGTVSVVDEGRGMESSTKTKSGNQPDFEIEDLEDEHRAEPNVLRDFARGQVHAEYRREHNLMTLWGMAFNNDDLVNIKGHVQKDKGEMVPDSKNENKKDQRIGGGHGKALDANDGRGKRTENLAEDEIELYHREEDVRKSGKTEDDTHNERGSHEDGKKTTLPLTLKRCKELLELFSQSKKLRLESQTWLHVPLCFMMFSTAWYFPILLRNYSYPDLQYSDRLPFALYLIFGTITKLAPAFSNQLVNYKKKSLLDEVSLKVMNTADADLRKALLKLHASISDKYPDSPNILLDFDLSLIDILVNMTILSETTFF